MTTWTSTRQFPERPPREQPPNDNPVVNNDEPTTANPPGDYNPIGVGSNSSEGFGNTNVLGAWSVDRRGGMPPVSPWSGWPNDWATPQWSQPGGFVTAFAQTTDVVYACLDLNSSILSTMPPYITHGVEPEPDRPWLINPEPMVYPSWPDFMKALVWSYLAAGEAFVYATARYADGYPSRFMLLNPSLVQVERIGGEVEYRVAGVPVDAADVLHIRYLHWPGDLHGHGPLEAAGARLAQVSALVRYATNMAATGALPPAVIKYPRRASRAQMQQMQVDWVNARASRMGLPAVLADGAELDVVNPQLKDAALSDLAKFSEARIAVLLGVPPFLLGLPSADAGTYVNSTNVFDYHWRASLRPKAEAITAALSGWLLPRGWNVEVNRDDYTRPGMFERAQAYQMLIASGVLTPDEVRARERYAGRAPSATTGVQTAEEDTTSPGEPSSGPTFGTGGRPTQTNTGA